MHVNITWWNTYGGLVSWHIKKSSTQGMPVNGSLFENKAQIVILEVSQIRRVKVRVGVNAPTLSDGSKLLENSKMNLCPHFCIFQMEKWKKKLIISCGIN